MQFSLYFILSILLSVSDKGIESDTVLPNYLQDIEIVGDRISSPIKSGETRVLKLDMEYMHSLPKILGNADPLRYTQMLPGVQTNSDIDAGVHIYGNESSHNVISIGGIPVYNPTHLLGLFSVFNAPHFLQMAVTKSAAAGDGYGNIGGIVDMELRNEVPEDFNGEVSVGLISSQGTLQIPLGKRAALFTSLRLSYINLLYNGLLKVDEGQLHYTFGDVDITYLQKIKDNQTLHIDFYAGLDKGRFSDVGSKSYYDTSARWGNLLGAVHWDCKLRDGSVRQSLYFSGYSNMLSVNGGYRLSLPSEIYDFGYRAEGRYKKLEYGLSLINHNITPQSPVYGNQNIVSFDEGLRQKVLEAALYAKYSGNISRDFYYDVALKGDVYTAFDGYNYQALNPYVKIGYDNARFGDIGLSYSTQHQYLLNCGFSALGLPVEFWLAADADNRPQVAHALQLSYRRDLLDGKYDVSVEAYYKRLYNQVEYKASPLDILNKQYSVNDVIISGDGYNYGASVMLNKLTGKLTGWVSYSFGRALRRYGIYGNKLYPSNFERIHELNVVACYKINDRLDVGGTFCYASGTPYTAVKYMYVINGNILTEFGEHNANRLRDYIRLDLSVNYDFINREGCKFGANLSLYNALGCNNELNYGLKVKGDSFRFQCTSFITTILPSLSLYYKF